jgi:predicted lipid carrier protein YhbT
MSSKSLKPGLLRKFPPLMLQPARFVPHSLKKPVVEFGLGQFFKESIQQDDLQALEGRRVLLEIRDLKLQFLIGVVNGVPRLIQSVREPDVSIRGNLEEFILLASNREDPDTQFFQRRITIEGDTDLGLEVKNLIYSLDPDRLPGMVNRLLDHLGWLVEKTKAAGL